jgi:hypothetical protein
MQLGSGRHAGICIAKLCTHRAVIGALALLAFIGVDGVDLFDVADGTVRTLGFAGPAGLAEFGNNFVSHDVLLERKKTFE